MSDNCMYPDLAARTGYNKGCRCLRCKNAKALNSKKQTKYRKIYNEKYRQSEAGKAARHRWNHRYKHSPKGKITGNASAGKRRAKIKCPLSLGDKEKIRLIYEECYRITQETGIPHHVDHIIPLALGGLHHPSNLQILTAEANLKKGCKILT